MPTSTVERFTATVNNYIKYRPIYPHAIIDTLIDSCHLTPQAIIADVGSGTGLLTKLLLDKGNKVFAVEPNQAMRGAVEQLLQDYDNFISVAGSAESTTLPDQNVDFITVGTAFHWFDRAKTKTEFQRILKPKGWAVLVWNVRDVSASPYMEAYERLLLDYAIDYQLVRAEKTNWQEVVKGFFQPAKVETQTFPNKQVFDKAGFQGRLLSTSYAPKEGHVDYERMMRKAEEIFNRYQKNGQIEFIYVTKMYFARLKG